MGGFIYLVRHGQTYWNKNHLMHGQYDIPLNDKGIAQARELAQSLRNEHFDICICSPLQRAHTTAIEILKYHPNVKILYDDRLMEINKGLLEGERTAKENMLLKEDINILKKYKVESKAHFFLRVSSLLDDITSKYKDKNVLLVSHSGTVKMAMFYFNPPEKDTVDEAYYKLHIKNCSCTKVKNEKVKIKPKLKLYNNYEEDVKQSEVSNKMKIGVYPMVADILHTGHIVAIEEAKKHCDYLIIALHCCPNYKEPVQTIYERYMQLRAVKWVDEVIPYTDINDAKNMLQSLDFDVYFLGEDHKGKRWECDDVIEALGKEVVYLSRKHTFSSSDLKSRIIEDDKKNYKESDPNYYGNKKKI